MNPNIKRGEVSLLGTHILRILKIWFSKIGPTPFELLLSSSKGFPWHFKEIVSQVSFHLHLVNILVDFYDPKKNEEYIQGSQNRVNSSDIQNVKMKQGQSFLII